MAASGKKYLKPNEFTYIIGDVVIDATFSPMSQDTYNETAVAIAIKNTNRVAELCMAAINMSSVGYGNKRYGLFKYKDTIVDIARLLTECGVKTNLPRDAKLKEDDLTPQRLCRAFREQIREYLLSTKFETYLFRKYSTRDVTFFDIMFRGAEYLDNLTPDQCSYLLAVYQNVDVALDVNITDRIKRVFQAKGYMPRQVPVV